MSDYHKSYRKRILIFAWITCGYLVFTALYSIIGIFITIPWSDDPFLYTYCTYALWFNAYTYYRFHQNSVYEERKEMNDRQWTEFYTFTGFQPYNHKKARRHIFLMSSLAIFANVALMVATRWIW